MTTHGLKSPAGYAFAGCFDTETTTLTTRHHARAFAVSYQWNDLRGVSLQDYTPGRDDRLHMTPTPAGFIHWIEDVLRWGDELNLIPVVAAYNLAFDLQTLLGELARRWPDMHTTAQSSKTLYTLELWQEGRVLLRFWDVYHLNKSGLSVMGLMAGLPKLTGSWDYGLVRTPSTPLTPEERAYALRDVQVIPAYLHALLKAYPWLDEDEFGVTVQTQTSLVRRYGRRTVGTISAGNGKTLWESYCISCKAELPKTWESYAARRACFRGGLCFTAAKTASLPVENVASLDATSMHHTFMARFTPVKFREADPSEVQAFADATLRLTREQILARYYCPFAAAFHARLHFTNLRLKPGSCFEEWGVGTLARSKFAPIVDVFEDGDGDEAEEAQLAADIRGGAFRDQVTGGVFAFGKLMEAREATVWVNEIELWIMSRVYAWDDMEALAGEVTGCWRKAPDYIGLESRTLYAQKMQVKALIRSYREGEPYRGEIGEYVPKPIADAARAGTLTGGSYAGNNGDLDMYYLYLKQMFNSIYGTTVQNEFRPGFRVSEGEVGVDPTTITLPVNFKRRRPPVSRALYTYGMRIVAGSRLHLVLAMEAIWDAFSERVDVLGGDTDSLKMRCDPDVTDEEIMAALTRLHKAADWCLERGYARPARLYASRFIPMTGVGHFEIEDCGRKPDGTVSHRWAWHVELWNKARVSFAEDGRADVTCAGLSQPRGRYTIADWYEAAARAHGPEWALNHGLGYNCLVANSVCHMLGRTSPSPRDTVDETVRDYRGDVLEVHAPEAISLYDVDKMVGDPAAADMIENLLYLHRVYGREPDTEFRVLRREDFQDQKKEE